jgi:hypothetical protein|tara:strand:+ start:16 stop:276 length:261 start_codon:yes stop_codon:yes gene_type:complete
MGMNKKQVDDYRLVVQSRLEELTVLNAKHNQDIIYVKESIDDIKALLKEQNGRVRDLEGSMSGVKAIGAMIAVVFSSLFGYLFTKG